MCQGLVSGRILDVSKQRSGVAGEEGQGMEGLGDSPPPQGPWNTSRCKSGPLSARAVSL